MRTLCATVRTNSRTIRSTAVRTKRNRMDVHMRKFGHHAKQHNHRKKQCKNSLLHHFNFLLWNRKMPRPRDGRKYTFNDIIIAPQPKKVKEISLEKVQNSAKNSAKTIFLHQDFRGAQLFVAQRWQEDIFVSKYVCNFLRNRKLRSRTPKPSLRGEGGPQGRVWGRFPHISQLSLTAFA